MSDVELSNLIGSIYDAALDPALWEGVLRRSADFVDGTAASIYSKDSVSKTADLTFHVGVEKSFQQSYLDKYVRLDPSTPGFFFFDVGEIITTKDILPYDEFLETRFYKEWVKPQRWVDTVTSVLEKSTTSYAMFSVFRNEDQGLATEEVRHRMKLLAPHVRRSVLIGKTIQFSQTEAATLTDVFDSLAASVFLLNGRGQLVRSNLSGHLLLSQGTILRATGGRLIAANADCDAEMRAAVTRAGEPESGFAGEGVVSLTSADGRHYVAHVLPLSPASRRRTGVGDAAVAVFVSEAQARTPAVPEIIAKLYRLTPSELRVLMTVFDGGGVSEVAAGLGISEATTKTHLHRLFAKTRTRRQSDLVKLVAGFANPTAQIDIIGNGGQPIG
jgi:DNA-binding CsgD family transcriptional regulator